MILKTYFPYQNEYLLSPQGGLNKKLNLEFIKIEEGWSDEHIGIDPIPSQEQTWNSVYFFREPESAISQLPQIFCDLCSIYS